MVALLPRGGVLSVGVLDLLAIDLVVTEPALLTVHRWWVRRPMGCLVKPVCLVTCLKLIVTYLKINVRV